MRRIPQSLSSRLLFALMLIALIPVLGLGIAAHISERIALTTEVETRLDTIAKLKEEQLTRWLNDRQVDLNLLSISSAHREYLMMLSTSESLSLENFKHTSTLRNGLSILTKNRPDYKRIEILDPEGRVIVSTDLSRKKGTPTNNEIFRQVIASPSGDGISDIHRDSESGQFELTFGRVIYEADQAVDNRDPSRIGAIIADVDLTTSFFGLVNSWPGREDSGEIILGRDDADKLIVLNSLRSVPSSQLRLRYPKSEANPSPLQLAIRGMSDATTAQVNGQSVIAAYRPVADTGWGLVVQIDASEVLQPISQFARQLLVVAILTGIAIWLATFFIWRRIADPLSNLIDATQKLIQDNYSVDLRVTHDDEVGLLTRSFQQMVATLDRRKRELQMANKVVTDTALNNTRLVSKLRVLNTDLEVKVMERTQELSAANLKLTDLDQLKSKFIANVSHELRNPVASLQLYLRLLEKSNDQNRARYVAQIANQIEWLSKLIENILDITQLERGLLDEDVSHVNLKLIVEQILETYGPIVEETPLSLEAELQPQPIFVSGSQGKLTQMITNLMANAVNYTPEGTIKVELRSNETDAILMIEDTGIGIEQEDVPHLFERFYRGKNTHELEIRGTGLGLGIVQDIVEIHKGHIEVESAIDVGSRFTIFLPLSKGAPLRVSLSGNPKAEVQGIKHRNQIAPSEAAIDIGTPQE